MLKSKMAMRKLPYSVQRIAYSVKNAVRSTQYAVRAEITLFFICTTVLLTHLCFGICHLVFAQEQFVYDAKGKRDPFIPLVTPDGRLLKLETEEDTQKIRLEGIIYDKQGSSYGIINGNVIRVGDTINEFRVLKIEENRVILMKEGELSEVQMKKEGP